MTTTKQKTKRQQRNEGLAVIVDGVALAIAMAEGVDLVGFFLGR